MAAAIRMAPVREYPAAAGMAALQEACAAVLQELVVKAERVVERQAVPELVVDLPAESAAPPAASVVLGAASVVLRAESVVLRVGLAVLPEEAVSAPRLVQAAPDLVLQEAEALADLQRVLVRPVVAARPVEKPAARWRQQAARMQARGARLAVATRRRQADWALPANQANRFSMCSHKLAQGAVRAVQVHRAALAEWRPAVALPVE
jgi:hypothetical protein